VAKVGLGADPISDFLKEDTGKPDVQHLAADLTAFYAWRPSTCGWGFTKRL